MKYLILVLAVISLYACTEAPKSTDDSTVKTDATITRNMGEPTPTDSLVIVADSTGMIMLGEPILTLDKLETKLMDSLQYIKKNYGKLPDTIILKTKGTVLMGMRGAIHDVISETKEKVGKQ